MSEAPLAELLQDERRNVWVCGPGLGPEAARATLPLLLSADRRVVADADVFSAFAGEPDALRGAAVLTPHAGEFARAFGSPGVDRVQAVRAAATRTGAAVLLKGADTIVAAPDGKVAINASAPPWLATAGSGDVLAGLIAGLLVAGHVAVGSRSRWRVPAWPCRCNRGARSGGGGSASGNHQGTGRSNVSAISAPRAAMIGDRREERLHE